MRGNPFIDRNGIMYQVERDSTVCNSFKGLINREKSTNQRYISFHVGSDLQIGDWLINSAGDRYIIVDKETTSFSGQPHDLKCIVKTEAEFNHTAPPTSNIFNIGTAHGSIIGSQTHFSLNYDASIQQANNQISSIDSPDKEELEQIISLLEEIVNNQTPVTKGLFSKFSSVMERHSWITETLASVLLNWLTSHTK